MRFFLKRLGRKKGLTLVEVVIATAIFAILLLAVFTMYQPIVRVVDMISDDVIAQRVVTSTEEFIAQQLRNATEIEIHWGTNWDTVRIAAVNAFSDLNPTPGEPGGFGAIPAIDADNGSANLTQAIVIHGGRLYNIRMTGLSSEALNAAFGSLEHHRVFNEAFYDGVDIDVQVGLSEESVTQQIRGETWFQMQIDALRDGDIALDTRQISDTQLTWIGNPVRNNLTPQNHFRARITPQPSDGVAGNNDNTFFIIFYNNNVHANRVIDSPDGSNGSDAPT
ncbi:MAG: prepilin-type N-terminal cleavage/methylation domain-containing protein [Oscillospiraceae bacterium]|nr:prepilin-type N-terminal cleavage/methylation domain-containing protein [Oscillospiraceae bacterium]